MKIHWQMKLFSRKWHFLCLFFFFIFHVSSCRTVNSISIWLINIFTRLFIGIFNLRKKIVLFFSFLFLALFCFLNSQKMYPWTEFKTPLAQYNKQFNKQEKLKIHTHKKKELFKIEHERCRFSLDVLSNLFIVYVYRTE